MRKNRVLALTLAGALTLTSTTLVGCGQQKAETENKQEQIEVNAKDYYFGTLNLTYADYYYGEIEGINPDNETKGQYEAENKVKAAGYDKEGIYDAVTSATTQKSKAFQATFIEENEQGVNILGPANVNVAIRKELYDDVKKAAEEGKECKNSLMDFVSSLTEIKEEAPVEYKVINSDGTITKTIGTTNKGENINASITSNSTWGNYGITIEGLEVSVDDVQGVLLETSDGKKYGMEHEDNIWLQAGELAFSVKEFVEPHQNIAGFERYKDLPGKTITKITYLLSNADDIEVDTELFVKKQLDEQYAITAPEQVSYTSEGTEIPLEFTLPEKVEYTLSAVSKGRQPMDISNVSVEDDKLTLPADFKPGMYKFVFSNDEYADLAVRVLVDSKLEEQAITFDGTKLVMAENENKLTIADYISGITEVSVNNQPVKGHDLGATLFKEDGTLVRDAVIAGREGETKVFDGNGPFKVSLSADGYHAVELDVE